MTKHLSAATAQQLNDHVHALATSYQVRIIDCPQLRPDEAFAFVPRRMVFAHPIIEETTYAVVLHELGHICRQQVPIYLTDVISGHAPQLQLDEETAAWQWARQQALIWSPAMEAVAMWALDTYAAKVAQQRPTPAAPTAPAVPKQQIDWSKYR